MSRERGFGDKLDDIFRVEAESAERLGDKDVATLRQVHFFEFLRIGVVRS